MDDKQIIRTLAEQVMSWVEVTEPMQDHDIRQLVKRSGVPHWVIDFAGRFIVFDSDKDREWNPLESIADAFEMQESILAAAKQDDFVSALAHILDRQCELEEMPEMALGLKAAWLLLNATARQRCLAAIAMLEVKG